MAIQIKHEGKKVIIEGDLDKDKKKDEIVVYLRSAGKRSKGARAWLSSITGASRPKKKKSSKSKSRKKSKKKSKKSRKKKK